VQKVAVAAAAIPPASATFDWYYLMVVLDSSGSMESAAMNRCRDQCQFPLWQLLN
jgi:hypothetical protein